MRFRLEYESKLPPMWVAMFGALVAIVAVGLLLGMGRVPLGALQSRPQLLLTATLALFVVILSIAHLEYGLLMLPVAAVVIPFGVGTGTGSTLVASLLLSAFLVAVWVVRLLVTRDFRLRASPVNVPLVGFVLTALLATFDSNVMRDPLVSVPASWSLIQAGGLSVFVLSAGVLLVVLNGLRRLRWIRWVVWLYLGLGAITILGFLAQNHRDLPGVSTGGLFSLWVVALAFGQCLFNHKLPTWGRAGMALLVVAWFYRRFFLENEWLSGWVPIAVALLTISLLKSRIAFLATVGLVLVVGLSSFNGIYEAEVNGAESEGNFFRGDIWAQNLELTKNHLLLGTGPAGYAVYYMSYFPDRGYSSHSNYLDVFAQTGLIGSAFFIWFLFSLFRTGHLARRRWKDGFAAGVANGIVGGMVGLLVAMALGDWFIPFVYNQTIAGFRYTVHSWMLLGVLSCLLHVESD